MSISLLVKFYLVIDIYLNLLFTIVKKFGLSRPIVKVIRISTIIVGCLLHFYR